MKSWLKSRLTVGQISALRRMLNLFQFSVEYVIDAKRFFKSSSVVLSPKGKGQLAAHLTMDYHRLEKGLALSKPRMGFGKDVVDRILVNLQSYKSKFGEDDLTATVYKVLQVYQSKQENLGYKNPVIDSILAELDRDDLGSGGVKTFDKEDLFPVDPVFAKKFLTSRHSVRQYTGELISDEEIKTIVRVAQLAPSVCNRQSGRIYCANTREKINELLALQNGNRGFGDSLGGVFVITSDLRAFTSLGERNQGYVDGGIFAMQALLAIHAFGLGGCMLNWSMTSKEDRKLRLLMKLPKHEIVITMIGFGRCPEKFDVAASPRVHEDNVLTMLF